MYTEHLRVPVGAGHLHVERVGRGGPPVVLVHGFGSSSFLWRNVAPELANAGYTALAVDLLGHGESDRSESGEYALEYQAELLERALTALRIPTATCVGQDIGGVVSLLLAIRRPRQIGKLVMLSPPELENLPPESVRSLQRSSARAVISSNELFGAFPLIRSMLSASVAKPENMTERHVARYAAPFVGSDGVSHLLMLARACELENVKAMMQANVMAQTLIVVGEADNWTPPGTATRIARWMGRTQAQIVTLPDTGYLIAEDSPSYLVSNLLDYLAAPVQDKIT